MLRRQLLLLCGVFLFGSLATRARADTVYSTFTSDPTSINGLALITGSGSLGGSNYTGGVATEFSLTSAALVNEIDVVVSGSNTPVIVALYDDNIDSGYDVPGTELASDTVTPSADPSVESATFSSVPLLADTNYWVAVRGTTTKTYAIVNRNPNIILPYAETYGFDGNDPSWYDNGSHEAVEFQLDGAPVGVTPLSKSAVAGGALLGLLGISRLRNRALSL